MEDAAGEEERSFQGWELSIEKVDRVVGSDGVIVLGFFERGGPPVSLAGVELDAGVGKLPGGGLGPGPGVERGGANPGVVVEDQAMIVVPLVGRIVTCGVMVDLARAARDRQEVTTTAGGSPRSAPA